MGTTGVQKTKGGTIQYVNVGCFCLSKTTCLTRNSTFLAQLMTTNLYLQSMNLNGDKDFYTFLFFSFHTQQNCFSLKHNLNFNQESWKRFGALNIWGGGSGTCVYLFLEKFWLHPCVILPKSIDVIIILVMRVSSVP